MSVFTFSRGSLFGTVASLLAVVAASAQSTALVCSLTNGLECDSALDCGPPAQPVPAPTFIHIDLDAGQITLLAPEERRGEVTQVQATTTADGQIALAGAEAGRAWGIVLDEGDLSLSVTITEEDAGIVAFGQCIPSDQTSPSG